MEGTFYSTGYLELYHYGIKGMRWGVRRFQNKDGSLTPDGEDRYRKSKGERDHSKSRWSHLKRIGNNFIRHLSSFNLSGLKNDVERVTVKRGQAFVKTMSFDKERKRSDGRIDPDTGFKMKTRKMSRSEDAERVNPGYFNFNDNTKRNCVLSTLTYELRRRGYDVRAKKASHGYKTSEISTWFPGIEYKDFGKRKDTVLSYREMDELKGLLARQGNGARGNLSYGWSIGGRRGRHSMSYEIVGRKVIGIDAQKGEVYNDINVILEHAQNVRYARIDNVDFDPKFIKEVAE